MLDTNIVIAALNGVEPVPNRLRGVAPREVGIPIVVIAELAYGAHRSQRREANLMRVEWIQRTFTILPVTEATVGRYGAVRAALEANGLAKSDFDLLIACSALECGGTLITHDGSLKDASIEGLVVEDWLDRGSPTRP